MPRMQKIRLDKTKSVILIDASYYVFYRYFATLRWFSFQNIEYTPDTIIENDVFMSAFYKHVQSDLNKLCKKWKTDTKNIIFCMDCFRCEIWRNDIYKEYKASRNQNQKFNRNIFHLFYDFISKLNIQTLSSERLEADDVIFITQQDIKKYFKNVIIISNDSDFMQLASDNIYVFNMQFKELKSRGSGNPKTDLYIKAIYGDKSDNIGKIASGLTKEKAQSIASMQDAELIEYLKENNMYDKFVFNMKLIAFENIPMEHINKYHKNVKIILE